MRRIPVVVALITLAPLTAVGLIAGPATAETTCDGKAPTIVAVAGAATTTGTPGDDVILGTDDGNAIDGLAGNDTICGLGGDDRLIGGAGDDRLFGGLDGEYYADDGYYGDELVPGPGNDFVDLGDDPQAAEVDYVDRLADYDTVVFADAPGPVTVDLSAGTATGEGTDTIVVPTWSGGIVGSAYDDVLTGSVAPDRIVGGAGDDRIDALSGDDDLEPGDGDDVVSGGDGDDIVVSPEGGREQLSGDAGEDYIEAKGVGTLVDGGAGDDYLVAGTGVDVRGGRGDDEIGAVLRRGKPTVVDGGSGRDIVRLRALTTEFARSSSYVVDVPRRRVTVAGTKRADYRGVEDLRFTAKGGSVTYVGGPGPDIFSPSNALRVTARGRGGADELYGGRLADLLDGGAGRDRLDGRAGRDRCVAGEVLRQCESRR